MHLDSESSFDDVDAITAFDNFGVVVMTDLMIETRKCRLEYESKNKIPAQKTLRYKNDLFLDFIGWQKKYPKNHARHRSYFPETWLWDLVPTKYKEIYIQYLP